MKITCDCTIAWFWVFSCEMKSSSSESSNPSAITKYPFSEVIPNFTDFQILNFKIFFRYSNILHDQLQFLSFMNHDNFKEMALTYDWINDYPKIHLRNKFRTLFMHQFLTLNFTFCKNYELSPREIIFVMSWWRKTVLLNQNVNCFKVT